MIYDITKITKTGAKRSCNPMLVSLLKKLLLFVSLVKLSTLLPPRQHCRLNICRHIGWIDNISTNIYKYQQILRQQCCLHPPDLGGHNPCSHLDHLHLPVVHLNVVETRSQSALPPSRCGCSRSSRPGRSNHPDNLHWQDDCPWARWLRPNSSQSAKMHLVFELLPIVDKADKYKLLDGFYVPSLLTTCIN